jgi:hypothetical protein
MIDISENWKTTNRKLCLWPKRIYLYKYEILNGGEKIDGEYGTIFSGQLMNKLN